MDKIIVFTDGSSRGNPGPGGWGAIVSMNGKVAELGGHEAKTTNNKMELMAAIEALNFILENKSEKNKTESEIIINIDSSYVVQGITNWVKGWVRNDWMTAAKEPVLNKELWEKLASVVAKLEEKHAIKWDLLKGHVGVPGNERCDEIATSFADKEKINLYKGDAKKYPINLAVVSGSKIKKEVSLEKKIRAKQKAFSYVSLVNGEVKIHKTWSDCEARVRGVSGAKFKKAVSKEDEQSVMREFGK